jgi:hypothetical protein
MRKIIAILSVFFALNTKAQIGNNSQSIQQTAIYIPVALHDFGIDSITGLRKQLLVKSLFLDAEHSNISVNYDIILLSPNGIILKLSSGNYIRDNGTSAHHFDTLRASSLGIGISASILEDLNNIKSIKTYINDLLEQ